MPLVKFEVRNEYGLGDPGLYNAKNNRNDYDLRKKKKDNESKEILDGVAVAGLVGILRQLGDLAQLASDIFCDLHELVMVTSARGSKLSTRIQNLEANLPLLENAIKGQRSHIHFAYVSGCDWRANLRLEQSHLLSSDLPQYMIDSYEECRNPPQLYLLDKFDINGNGACLRRYSDPSYFKRVRAAFDLDKVEKVQGEKKAHKLKRNGSQLTNKESRRGSPLSRRCSSTRFTYFTEDEHNFSPDTVPTSATRAKPELESRPSSFDSRSLNLVEPYQESNSSGQPDESIINSSSVSKSAINQDGIFDSNKHEKLNGIRTCSSSLSVTWDEKAGILKPVGHLLCDNIPVDDAQLKTTQISSCQDVESDISTIGIQDAENVTSNNFVNVQNNVDEVTSEADNYMDALYTLESETETDTEFQTTRKSKSSEGTLEIFGGSRVLEEPLMQPHQNTLASLYPHSSIATGNQVSNDSDYIANDQTQVLGKLKSSEDTSEIFGGSKVLEEPLMQPHQNRLASLYPHSSVDTGNQVSDDNNCVVNDQTQMLGSCNSSTKSENSNADIADRPQCTSKENGCNENTYHLITPYLTEIIQNPNFSMDTQISDRNSIQFEVVNDQPTESTTCSSPRIFEHDTPESKLWNSPCNKISTGNITEIEAPNDHNAPESYVYSSTSMLGSNTNEDKPTSTTPVYASSIPTPKLWTNGILLGLAPSKPPVFSVSNDSNDDLVSSTITKDLSTGNHNCGKRDNVIQQISQNGTSKNHTELQPNESSQNTVDIKSSLSSLAQKILANSMQRKQSSAITQSEVVNPDFNRPQNSKVASEACFTDEITSSKTTGQSNSQVSGYSSPPFEHMKISFHPMNGSQVSGNSSPPLEHMKISFHPMNGSITSKLNLEYSDDLKFPSFQLLPKSDTHLEENDLETDDDDTFCRSDRYSSEDHESNSEMWEQDDLTGDINHDTYNDLNRISLSSSSVSSFKGFFQVGHKVPTYQFEKLEPENRITCPQKNNSTNISVQDSFVSAVESRNKLPPPPPLPPIQLATENDSFGKEIKKDSCVTEIVEHLNDMHMQSLTGHKQQEQNTSMAPPFPKTMRAIQKLSRHTKPNSISNYKEVSEMEELLLQIRNRSFNLRHTSTTKSRSVSLPTPNENVAAILEKATAIRQAFAGKGAHDDDDDNWSCN